MKVINTKKSIWNNNNLMKRILITIGLTTVYMFGTYVVIPGVDPRTLTGLSQQTGSGLMILLDMFSGGAFSNASIFALGIISYISASIVMLLLVRVIPPFRKMRSEGESGRSKINRIIRYLTVVILVVQSFAYLTNLQMQIAQAGALLQSELWFTISSIIIMTAGGMFVLWLGDRITDKGIGNGILLLILFGIINRLPSMLLEEFSSRMNKQTGGFAMFFMEALFLILVITGAILLVQGVRKTTNKVQQF